MLLMVSHRLGSCSSSSQGEGVAYRVSLVLEVARTTQGFLLLYEAADVGCVLSFVLYG